MGVQGTKKSAEALHEIFMAVFLFIASSFSSRKSESIKDRSPEHRKHVEMAPAGLSLTFWGMEG